MLFFESPSTTATSSSIHYSSTTSNRAKCYSINELRAVMAMNALNKNSISIASSLPPTQDALFYHCLRISRQVQIWMQAPDGYIKYPDLEHSGYEMIDGRPQVKWTSKLPFPIDKWLSSCGKHKGQCTRWISVLHQLPCTMFRQCPDDCSNRKSIQTTTPNSQTSTVSSFHSIFYVEFTLSANAEFLESG